MAPSLPSHSTMTITTDGAVLDNPGAGGWAALLEYSNHERLLVGEATTTVTNNQMELDAVIAALTALKRACHVVLRSDSQYVLNGMQQLGDGQPLPRKNRARWHQLADAMTRFPHTFSLTWVPAHAGDPRNERVHQEAHAAAQRVRQAHAAVLPLLGSIDAELPPAPWVVALCSAAAHRPPQWAVVTPTERFHGAVAVTDQPHVGLYRALIASLTAAQQLPHAAQQTLLVVTNVSLLVKQQRGEWAIKDGQIRAYQVELLALRTQFAGLAFAYAETDIVLPYCEESP
ncbi:MAG: reverse transcriptase-like protein [Chloroflexaceae bacterium]|nr:reverse transcriptase-like protein [Chloroflexaceae bacterium]